MTQILLLYRSGIPTLSSVDTKRVVSVREEVKKGAGGAGRRQAKVILRIAVSIISA